MTRRRSRDHGSTVVALEAASIAGLLGTIGRMAPLAVIFEGPHLLEAVKATHGAFPALPIVVDFHNIESGLDLAIRLGRFPRALRPLARLAMRGRHRRAIAADLAAATLAGRAWTCSDADRRALRDLGFGGPVDVVPNPVPGWCLTAPPRQPQVDPPMVLFVGHLSYPPNRRSVAQLCRRIMPLVRQVVPTARLHVCGRTPHAKLAAMVTSGGDLLTADAPDLAPIYRQATVLAVPLSEGGGTRIKIIEALAIGCPVVASAKAVEGLGLVAGRHFIGAETPQDFAKAITALIHNPASAQPMMQAGADLVHDRFGAAAIARSVRRALEPADGLRNAP